MPHQQTVAKKNERCRRFAGLQAKKSPGEVARALFSIYRKSDSDRGFDRRMGIVAFNLEIVELIIKQ